MFAQQFKEILEAEALYSRITRPKNHYHEYFPAFNRTFCSKHDCFFKKTTSYLDYSVLGDFLFLSFFSVCCLLDNGPVCLLRERIVNNSLNAAARWDRGKPNVRPKVQKMSKVRDRNVGGEAVGK